TCSVFSAYLFFTAPPSSALYTLSLHDALPILSTSPRHLVSGQQRSPRSSTPPSPRSEEQEEKERLIRKRRKMASFMRRLRRESRSESTRLNSSHVKISYAVFCLKKKKY